MGFSCFWMPLPKQNNHSFSVCAELGFCENLSHFCLFLSLEAKFSEYFLRPSLRAPRLTPLRTNTEVTPIFETCRRIRTKLREQNRWTHSFPFLSACVCVCLVGFLLNLIMAKHKSYVIWHSMNSTRHAQHKLRMI